MVGKRNKFLPLAIFAIASIFATSIPNSVTAATSLAGKSCLKLGSLSVSGMKIFTCILVNKKLVWNQGKAVVYAPLATPTPAPTVTVTATPAPAPTITVTAIPTPVLISGRVTPSAMAFKPTTDWPIPLPTLTKGPYTAPVVHSPAGITLKWPDEILGIDQLHNQGITGKNVSVAFIEYSNINVSDPYFANTKVICIGKSAPVTPVGDFIELPCPTTSLPELTHATGVAGTIAGVHGIAPGATLISIASTFSSVQAVKWVAANADKYGIKILSISIGGGGPDERDYVLCGHAGAWLSDWQQALAALASKDIALLQASGNNNEIDGLVDGGCLPGVIAVGATNNHSGHAESIYEIASYSNVSADLDLLSPSTLFSEGLNNQKQEFGGTSQATPFAAGVFALAKSARPDANMAQIFYFLKSYATPIDDIIVKGIPMLQPLEAITALVKASSLPPVNWIRDLQAKSSK